MHFRHHSGGGNDADDDDDDGGTAQELQLLGTPSSEPSPSTTTATTATTATATATTSTATTTATTTAATKRAQYSSPHPFIVMLNLAFLSITSFLSSVAASSPSSIAASVASWLRRVVGSLIMAWAYVTADVRRQRRAAVVGLTTVFLVVFYTVVLQTMISRSSLLFLKLAENSVGEFDLLLTPSAATASQSLSDITNIVGTGNEAAPSFTVNTTAVSSLLQGHPDVVGVAPRWLGYARAIGRDNPPATYSYLTVTANNTVVNVTAVDKGVMTVIVVMDTLLEKQIGIAPAWKHRPLGSGECHVSSSLLRSLGVRPRNGEALRLSVNTTQLLSALGLADTFNATTSAAIAAAAAAAAAVTAPFNTGANLTATQIEQLRLLLQNILILNNNPNNNNTNSNNNITQTIIDALLNATDNGTVPITPPPPTIPASVFLNATSLAAAIESALLVNFTTLTLDCNVIDPVGRPMGKWPAALGNAVVLEKKYLLSMLLQSVNALLANYNTVVSLLAAAGVNTTALALPLPAGLDLTSSSSSSSSLSSIRIDDYSLLTIIRYSRRSSVFILPRRDLYQHMSLFTNSVSEALGISFPAVFQIPLAEAVASTYIFRLFLDQIFNASLAILVVLGALLIYSLMLADVEEKTFEYGMLRALGLRAALLADIIVTQALYFAVPGIALGLLAGALGYLPLASFMSTYSFSPVVTALADPAIATAVTIGLVVPLLANILPIRRALSRTLRDALDRYHQTSQQVTVAAVRLEDYNISFTSALVGFLLVVIGFIVYYLIPASFIFQNLPLFLGLLTGILIAMIMGLIIVAQSLQGWLERRVLSLVLWGEDRHLLHLIAKNMGGHARRNRKTALMFTIALGFALFASSMSTLLSSSIVDSIRALTGADILVQSFSWGVPINYLALRAYLTSQIASSDDSGVEDFAFVTLPLFYYDAIDDVFASTLAGGGIPVPITVYGIERNYLSATFSDFVIAPLYDTSIHYKKTSANTIDFVASLYDERGKGRNSFRDAAVRDGSWPHICAENSSTYSLATTSVNNTAVDAAAVQEARVAASPPLLPLLATCNNTFDMIVSYAITMPTSIALTQPASFTVRLLRPGGRSLHYTFLPRAFVSKLPGFFLSSYSITSWLSGAFVTMDVYDRLLDDLSRFSTPVPSSSPSSTYRFRPSSSQEAMGRCVVKMKKSATSKQRETIINGLRVFVDNDNVQLIDTAQSTKYAAVATSMLLLYFSVVSVIALLLCFFVLWLSFTANMRDNSWELGVLRALGLSFPRVLRCYIYEGCCVIVAAMTTGVTIGLLVSLTLTLQFNLFTEMPLNYSFPSSVFVVLLLMTFFSLIVGTTAPGLQFQKKPIANLLKGL